MRSMIAKGRPRMDVLRVLHSYEIKKMLTRKMPDERDMDGTEQRDDSGMGVRDLGNTNRVHDRGIIMNCHELGKPHNFTINEMDGQTDIICTICKTHGKGNEIDL